MKKLLFLCLPLALLYACGDKAHKTELIFDKGTEGLHIVSARDTFNKFKGSYYVIVEVKNDTKDIIDNFLVKANYIDEAGDIGAQTTAGAGRAIAPGATLKVENTYDFPDVEHLPFKVNLSVKDMFK